MHRQRPNEAAKLARKAGIQNVRVSIITPEDVRAALHNRLPDGILDVLPEDATFYKIGIHYYLDDPNFGAVFDVENLRYDADLGLYACPVPSPVSSRGRRPLPTGERKERVQIFLKPATVARLTALAEDGESLGQTLDRFIAAH